MAGTRGHCLCGAVSYEYSGPENWQAYCHCESCRRNTASPVTAFFAVPRSAFRFSGKAPAVYRSSPGVRRLFCADCGTPMAYDSDRYPDEIHLYAATLEDPENYAPEGHVHVAERLSWFDVKDDLPRHPGSG
ncbi:MAG: GFA family protein [Kiloniellaceae bacterium]